MADDEAGDGPGERPPLSPGKRRKRPAPTIDLKASEIRDVSNEASTGQNGAPEPETAPGSGLGTEANAAPGAAPELGSESESGPAPAADQGSDPASDPVAGTGAAAAQPAPERGGDGDRPARPVKPWTTVLLVPALSGAAAAVLVGAVFFSFGLLKTETPPLSQDHAALEALDTRLARAESQVAVLAKAPAPVVKADAKADEALSARIAALESTLAAQRGDLGKLRAQADAASAAIAEVKAAPQARAPTEALSAIEARLGKLEAAMETLAARPQAPASAAVDQAVLSRAAVALLLDQAVREGEPYAAALAEATRLGADPGVLQPLEGFAQNGVPGTGTLGRDLLALLPRLVSDAAAKTESRPEAAPASGGILDRLQHSAAALVHIQRIDGADAQRSVLVARVKAAAERGDIVQARRDLLTLAQADRAPVQPWLDKVAAREAALAASRRLTQQALTALARPVAPAAPH